MAIPNLVYNYVSRDAKVALEEFKTDFDAAYQMSPADQWATEIGFPIQTNMLRVTLPVPLSAAGYIEMTGDREFRRLSERHFSFQPKLWQDGFSEYAYIVEAPDFIGFQKEPQNMATAATNIANELVSALLESNPVVKDLEGNAWDGVTFFNSAHPANLLDSTVTAFSNDFTGSGTLLSIKNIQKARQNFRKIKGPNGKPLGVRMAGVLVPAVLEEQAMVLANQSIIAQALVDSSTTFGAVDNIYKGKFKVWVSDQLTSDLQWYPVGEKVGMYPWAIIDRGTPESHVLDKTSALFERESKVGFFSELQREAGLCFPQLVQRFAGVA